MMVFLVSAAAAQPADVWVKAPRSAMPAGIGFAEGRDGDWWRMHADDAGLLALDDAGIPWRSAAPLPPSPPAGYHTPEQMVTALESLAADWPALVQLVDVGTSSAARPIVGLKLTATDAPAAQWRVLGAHHGDELPSGELALSLATALLEAYGVDDGITALLDEDAVWVVPHVNPDGVASVDRYNDRDVDLNRNYSYQWSADAYRSGTAPFSEPETRAVRALHAWNPFGAGLSLHAGAVNIGWVWNYTTTPSPDSELLQDIAQHYTDLCTDPDFWATNGAEWYITYGDTNDWSYGQLGTLDFTIELSVDKVPDASTLPELEAAHLPAMMDFMRWSAVTTGQVVDAQTGQGIPAQLTIAGRPLHTGPSGRFARPVPEPGDWTAAVTAPGYIAEELTLHTDSSASIALQPASLVALHPDPVILSQGGDGWFQLDASTVTLTRPGEAPVTAAPSGAGFSVDVASMAPGPWSLEVDGAVAPRALFIGEVDNTVAVTGARVSRDTLRISGDNLGRGSQIFAMWGTNRAPVSLPITAESSTLLLADATALSLVTEPIDLLIISRGYQLAVHDALSTDGGTDTAAPDAPVDEPTDAPVADAPTSDTIHAGCAAAPSPGALAPLGLVLLSLAFWRNP